MSKAIKYAGVAGLLSLILAAPILVFEILKISNKLEGGLVQLYIFVLLVSLILYVIFLYGFKLVGEKYQNHALILTSYIWLISTIIYYGYLILTLILPSFKSVTVQISALVISGATAIPFGISLLKLKPQFGSIEPTPKDWTKLKRFS